MSQVLISIVDDEKSVREATKSLVRSLGYQASTFASADDFLKSEQVHDTSCLISDVQMPGLSGIDLQDRLIARGHCIPIKVTQQSALFPEGADSNPRYTFCEKFSNAAHDD